ncbi:uncharacterized protein BJX67DRAFT_41272 [Aspergillus lucknowensis]|uniref:Amine oxidase domain-containing protein n=1 Tax=Aspergillus lucknowensis TaxID=176173 RepID=A0ABR4LVA2_9EURO
MEDPTPEPGSRPGPPRQRQRVAIVGSGMAGLVSGYLLANDKRGRFEVEILEMQDRLSLDSASYTLPLRDSSSSPSSSSTSLASEGGDIKGKEVEGEGEGEDGRRVDLPMRAFAAGFYDNLRKMYTHLGVQFEEPRFVYSLSTLVSPSSSGPHGDKNKHLQDLSQRRKGEETVTKTPGLRLEPETYFIHSSNNHILPPIRPAGMSALKWIFEVTYLLFWYAWFTIACFLIAPKTRRPRSNAAATATPKDRITIGESETIREYLRRIGIPAYYTTRYFLPLMSSVTTCTHDELLDFPAIDVVDYARRTYRQPHYTLKGGVRQAEGKLSKGLNVRFGARVTNVQPTPEGRVRVSWTNSNPTPTSAELEEEEEYDKVIIAVTPDVVGSIFVPLASEMKTIPTRSVQSIVHHDFSRVESCSAFLARSPGFQKQTAAAAAAPAGVKGSASSCKPRAVPAAIHMITDLKSSRTESIHEHPSRMLITTYPLEEDGIDESTVLHRARFTRVLRSARSRDVVNSIFDTSRSEPHSGKGGRDNETRGWKNGDGGVYLVGGWCWDGMVMLEGCIVSAIRVADALGVDVPWIH